MALGGEEATFNAAVDTFMAAWEALVDHLDAGEEVKVVWVDSKKGSLAADSTQGTDTAIAAKFGGDGRVYYWKNHPNTTDNMPFEVQGKKLFWKVTNAAGDLT